jgi:hypothetical protein
MQAQGYDGEITARELNVIVAIQKQITEENIGNRNFSRSTDT